MSQEVEKIKDNNKELKKTKPFTFIHISLKLFFIESFNKVGSAIAQKKLKRKVKKANKEQLTKL